MSYSKVKCFFHFKTGPAGNKHLNARLAAGLPGGKHPALPHWTQGSLKDVCWAPFTSPCWPMTAHCSTAPTSPSSLQTTRLWWVSSATKRQTRGARSAAWPCGVKKTIWTWRRQRRWRGGDFRKTHPQHAPLTIYGATEELNFLTPSGDP